MRASVCAIGVVLAVTGCSSGDREAQPSVPELASGKAIPARCVTRKVRPAATVTFVANGIAWALEPRSGRLSCLFRVGDPGPFVWGPRGDRALLARLEVKALDHAPRRPPTRVNPPASSWGRPIGKSIVFVGRGGRALLKAHPGGGGFTDVTPVQGARYKLVTYHPSGLAFAFVLRRGGRESLWISSNVGKTPRLLVHGRLHTGFDALAFGKAGTVLYFAARHRNGDIHVHSLELVGATSAGVAWIGKRGEPVSELFPDLLPSQSFGELAFTAGSSCESRRAILVTTRHRAGVEALPGDRPSRARGWLDAGHVLVAAGGCGEKVDLYSVSKKTLKARLLVRRVDTASVRLAEPSPPPPLSVEVLQQGSGFA